jgi:ADP-ribosyl-[dinitrogen reductase] hydrolase
VCSKRLGAKRAHLLSRRPISLQSSMNKTNRLKGGLYGLLIGDALGVPYEFHLASAIPPRELIDMTPPARFRRSHASVKPGTWSDDGALALCLLDSLIEKDGLDLENLATKFLRWGGDGYMAVDGHVFDMGNQTSRALENLKSGMSPVTAGPSDERSNGNGSLMRALPLALWHRGGDEELVGLAHAQSLPTHGHVHSQVCCALYVLVARHLLDGQTMDDAWDRAEAELATLYRGSPFASALEFVLSVKSSEPQGSGYVVDSLWSARSVCQESTYAGVVKAAVALGNDTDTTACIAGGLAGVHFGFDAIPLRWMDILRGRDMVKPLERGLLLRG